MEPFNFGGLKFTRFGLKDCAIHAMEAVKGRRKFVVAVPSSRMVYYAQKDINYRDYVNQANLAIPDSTSYVWASKLTKTPVKQRVTGPDFMMEICKLSSTNGCKVYFLGTKESTLIKLSENLKQQFSSLDICGIQPLPFGELSEMGTDDILDQINRANPDVLFVGMSAPKQEFWIKNNMDKVNAYLFAGVGAAFDFYSEEIPRAPAFLRSIGLEWAHRHIIDPKRNVLRVIKTSPYYLYLIFILILINHGSLLRFYMLFRILKDDGLFRCMDFAFKQVINYEKRYIWIRKFTRELKPGSHYEYKELDEDTLLNIQYNKSIRKVEKFSNIAYGAQRCFGVYEGIDLISLGWVYLSGCPMFELKKKEAFIGPVVTIKSHHRSDVKKHQLLYVSNVLRGEGYSKVYSTTSIADYPSINGLSSADFRISHIQKKLLIFGKRSFRFKVKFFD
jgi:N-acetylglucosaminyldiphosphoundecaprenol N-acetyl-beta-D-mannosaminyltransferase